MASITQQTLAHLRTVIDTPTTKLDVALLERTRRESIQTISAEDRLSAVSLVVELLQNIQQDPSPATKLAEDLVEPWTFSDILAIKPQVDLTAGLRAPSPPIQLLVLRLLSLAPRHVGDVGIVAGNPELVTALVDTWLRSVDIAVAESARQVLTALVLAEPSQSQQAGTSTAVPPDGSKQGLMQRRLFKDKNVYDLLFSLPSLKTVGNEGQLSKRDKTLAQGRLLDLLKEIWPISDVWTSQMPEIEEQYALEKGQGLIHFAALHMIDKSDVLLRVTQIDFFTDLILSIRTEGSLEKTDSRLLDFLTASGVHQEIISIYASPETQDPLDNTFLYAPAARYVAAFAQNFYKQFLSDTPTRTKIFKRLHEVLDAVPNSQWARNDAPGHDLHVLVSLPRLALVPDPILVLRLPTRPASADAFRTLATLFSGRSATDHGADVLTFPATTSPQPAFPPWHHIEQWAARYLFLSYLDHHPSFWNNIIDASSVTAFKDTAVAAIDLVHSIVRAQWQTEAEPSPGSEPFGVDLAGTDTFQEHGWYGSQPPANGVAAVLHPQVVDVLLPFIMKGPEGRGVALLGSDTESAAYHIHQAKLALTRALEVGIKDAAGRLSDGQEEKAMLTELAAGLSGLRRQGFSRQDEAGAAVGTMEL